MKKILLILILLASYLLANEEATIKFNHTTKMALIKTNSKSEIIVPITYLKIFSYVEFNKTEPIYFLSIEGMSRITITETTYRYCYNVLILGQGNVGN